MVGGDPAAMVRASLDDTSAAAVVAHLVENPADMQRPIAVLDGRAVIGRPSELVLDLLD
jgi:arsenate reductase-like glutaredoxin family protein